MKSLTMKKISLFITAVLFILCACRENKLKVDVSDINTKPLQVLRLDEDVFGLTAQNINEKSQLFSQKYGVIYDYYLQNPFRINGIKDTLYQREILAFINDKDVREAYLASQKIYNDLAPLTEELNTMVKRFKYHFPNRPLPTRVVTCLSGWNYAFAYMDSTLMVSLDMYLGDTSKFYQMLRYPQYQTRKMNAAHLLPDVARGWLLTEFGDGKPENTLLHHTIFYGKLFYAVNALLPETADSLLIGYTSKQMQLCNKYEKQYWSYFADKNRLYENSLTNIRELTSEGPFTGAISKDCPPRIAMWIGWQIVKSYMNKNEKVTLEQLMMDADAQKILTKSKYRP